jgi:glucose/sorbosone dehydrogenase
VIRLAFLAAAVLLQSLSGRAATAPAPLTLDLSDYLAMPITGKLDGTGQTDGMLARVNSFREEPGGTGRVFVHDLNGPLYILDKWSRTLSTYLNFNGRDGKPGMFRKLAWEVGFANGLVTFQFDPAYSSNGRFYTVHIEDPALDAPAVPDNTNAPGFDVSGYTVTAPIPTPGPITREGVLIEWTDGDRSNVTFEGTARELLRLQLNARIHPLGDVVFNPAARRGDSEWQVMYLGSGDGGSGESPRPDTRHNPQRLDTLVGKILRIVPSLGDHQSTSTVSDNGRYRIPNDNPFGSIRGARKEIWAVGFRNPHRLHWAIDPTNAKNNRLIANSIGMRTWETINIVRRGANYGYSLREGNEAMELSNLTVKRPAVDRIPIRINATDTIGDMTPTYPVVQYPHKPGGGDAIGSGYLYRGKNIPELRGKYVFSDISTGRLWYADYQELLKADDSNPDTMAAMHEIHLRWDDPNDTPDAGRKIYESMYPIAMAAYHSRGGKDPDLPGRATVSGEGRADAHFAVDGAGELYIFSKTDGMIRYVVNAR